MVLLEICSVCGVTVLARNIRGVDLDMSDFLLLVLLFRTQFPKLDGYDADSPFCLLLNSSSLTGESRLAITLFSLQAAKTALHHV